MQKPKPALLARIREELSAEPGISKSELARRVGVSRQTAAYYLRSMTTELRAAEERNAEVKDRSRA